MQNCRLSTFNHPKVRLRHPIVAPDGLQTEIDQQNLPLPYMSANIIVVPDRAVQTIRTRKVGSAQIQMYLS